MDKIENINYSRRLYSIKETVESYGATTWFWRNQIWSGKIPIVRVRNKQFLDRYDIEKFIKDHKIRILSGYCTIPNGPRS